MNNLNLFATVLTYEAPSSNYRGENENNRTVLQKLLRGEEEFTVISAESIRNAIRDILAEYGLPTNRSRLLNEDQPAVQFQDYPDPSVWIDDFFFGFMMACKAEDRSKLNKRGTVPKRDSLLRLNMAVALTPYQTEATFHQSPKHVDSPSPKHVDFPWKKDTSNLIHKEVVHTAYQYPFALSMKDCEKGPKQWTQSLIKAITELNGVAGGHARALYEFCPRSVVCRVTSSRVANYQTYGFKADGTFPELSRVGGSALKGSEFWVGGEVVRNMDPSEKDRLMNAGAHLFEEAADALSQATDYALQFSEDPPAKTAKA